MKTSSREPIPERRSSTARMALSCAIAALALVPGRAGAFNSGSTGADGALMPAVGRAPPDLEVIAASHRALPAMVDDRQLVRQEQNEIALPPIAFSAWPTMTGPFGRRLAECPLPW